MDPLDRALDAWAALEHRCLRRLGRSVMAHDGPVRSSTGASVWTLSQVLMAAIDVAHLTRDHTIVDGLLDGLERYRFEDGFGPFPGERIRYYDDNAWIALALLYLATTSDRADRTDLVADAARVFGFVASGEAPGGGVWWVESPKQSVHTCSTAPAAVIAEWLLVAPGLDDEPAERDAVAAFADRTDAYLDATLRAPDGLYRDNVQNDGRVDATFWSYNQGTPVGAKVQRAERTGDRTLLPPAARTARAALDHYGVEDRLWRQPPVFNAVFFRNLWPLARAVPLDGWTDVLDAYLDRAWTTARHRRTGLLTAGDIGRYEGGGTIDHAGLVQLLALRARAN